MEDTFRHNGAMREEECVCMDAMREEERVHMAQNTVIISSESSSSDDSSEILSDDLSDLGRRQIPTKPVTSSNKSSTFSAKHKSDNEETPLKQPHQDAFTSKQEILERIKQLHIKFGFLDTEHLSMLTNTWLEYQQYADVHVEITKKLYNAYCTHNYFFVEKYFESWDPKIHNSNNYLQSF